MRHRARLLSVVMALVWSGHVLAGPIGPFDDGLFYLPPGPVARWIQTRWNAQVGDTVYSGTDLVHIKKNGSVDVYVQADLFMVPGGGGGGIGPTPDDIDLVTIYGRQAPGGMRTGFEPLDGVSFEPDILVGFDGRERHWGGAGSGVEYASYLQEWVTADGLPAALPGADLTGFDTASATQSYALFRTTVPLSELITPVPEPSTWALCSLGLAGLIARRWRRKRHVAKPGTREDADRP
jgi:hypothetical protein